MRRIRYADTQWICERRIHCNIRRDDVDVCCIEYCFCSPEFPDKGYAQLGGLIVNAKGITNETEKVSALCAEINTEIVQIIPRCNAVQEAEDQNQTVVEVFPESEMARVYTALAKKLLEESHE